MAKTPEEMLATMISNLKEKTGKPLDAWLKIATASKKSRHGEIVAFLKSEHGMGHGYANLVAQKTLQAASGEAPVEGEDLVDGQYAGAKAGLRPIYDALLTAVGKFGGDVEIAPKKAYVSLRRSKQFAIVQPSTATRVDVGINLKGESSTPRLEKSGSFNAMVSHRVRVEKKTDVDAELIRWLRKAYEAA
ncbi:MAG TPA: DUF4287 domain-containing protein [Phycisphaerae bacterium]|nr:DUF4287 domain-containing protein [Phycisphaerae bacterium]